MPSKAQYAQNPELYKAKWKSWRQSNKDKHKTYNDGYRIENRVAYNAYSLAWHKRNPSHGRYFTAKRRAALHLATPPWLTPEQQIEIKTLYATCPITHEVDHIMPIQGKNSCGLHVPWNLQHLPISENRKKSNKVAK